MPLLLLSVLAVGRPSVHRRPVARLPGAPEGRRHRVRLAAGAARSVPKVLLAVRQPLPQVGGVITAMCRTKIHDRAPQRERETESSLTNTEIQLNRNNIYVLLTHAGETQNNTTYTFQSPHLYAFEFGAVML